MGEERMLASASDEGGSGADDDDVPAPLLPPCRLRSGSRTGALRRLGEASGDDDLAFRMSRYDMRKVGSRDCR